MCDCTCKYRDRPCFCLKPCPNTGNPLYHTFSQKKAGVFVHEETENEEGPERLEWYSYPDKLGKDLIPIYTTPALNERYYGKLQGRKKAENGRKVRCRECFPLALGF